MNLIAKNYKDIEEAKDSEFGKNIIYVNNVSLIGFGLRRTNNDQYYSTIYIDIAIRLDDL